MRIFIADDHESVLRRVRAMLEGHPGWEICGDAVDGRQAVEKVKATRPDVVVLDFAMPGMDGLKTAAAIKQLMPGVPIVMFSMYAKQLREEVQKYGISLLIDKARSADLVSELEKLSDAQTEQTSPTAAPLPTRTGADVQGHDSVTFKKVS
jgi:DNA-binding NarL/FixJ family response regulator